MRLGFLHDARRCTGCRTCVMACRNDHRVEPGLVLREVYPYREDPSAPSRHFLSVACNHCGEPECVPACPTGAMVKRPDGLVVLNSTQCIGCRLCMVACPYGAPRFSQREQKVIKCDFCHERLAAGQPPACVAACPTEALRLIDLDSCAIGQATADVQGFPAVPFTAPSIRFLVGPPDGQGGEER